MIAGLVVPVPLTLTRTLIAGRMWALGADWLGGDGYGRGVLAAASCRLGPLHHVFEVALNLDTRVRVFVGEDCPAERGGSGDKPNTPQPPSVLAQGVLYNYIKPTTWPG